MSSPSPVRETREVALTGLGAAVAVALVLAAAALIAVAGARGSGAAPVVGTDDAATTIEVALDEFDVVPSLTEVAAGTVAFVATNDGAADHDLVVDGTVGATATLAAGQRGSFEVDLAPGTYTLACSIAGHREAGMTTTLTVTGDDGATAAPAGHEGHGTDADWAAMDAAMHDTVLAFPAETTGRGNQPLEPEILADGTKRFELTAEIVEWEVAPGEIVEGWAYNGQIPGPMIRTEPGDRVQVEVTNRLPLGTDVHWHGIVVPNDQDGVAPLTQELIEPGASYTYEFVTEEAAVNMYHPHHHAQMKVPNGMWGVFLVGDLDLPDAGSTIGGRTLPDDLTIDQVVPMVVNDAGTIGMSINGKSFPATEPIVAQQGDNLLLHYYNEGLQIHPMHLHGLPQLVVGKDGFPLDQPYWADTVNVAPGERYSVLIPADDAGVWAFHCHILTHAEREDGMYGMVTALIVE